MLLGDMAICWRQASPVRSHKRRRQSEQDCGGEVSRQQDDGEKQADKSEGDADGEPEAEEPRVPPRHGLYTIVPARRRERDEARMQRDPIPHEER
jgi:hypothetical protein